MRMGRALEMYPDLTRDGLGSVASWLTTRQDLDPPVPANVDAAVVWLLENRDRVYRKTINLRQTSYGMKHVVERETGKYISNGDFICAAIMCGYKIKAPKNLAPNVFLNMKLPKPKGEAKRCGT